MTDDEPEALLAEVHSRGSLAGLPRLQEAIAAGEFMRNLAGNLRDGKDPAVALADARTEARQTGGTAWAAFHLIGA